MDDRYTIPIAPKSTTFGIWLRQDKYDELIEQRDDLLAAYEAFLRASETGDPWDAAQAGDAIRRAVAKAKGR